jgi:hypothetical protein
MDQLRGRFARVIADRRSNKGLDSSQEQSSGDDFCENARDPGTKTAETQRAAHRNVTPDLV